jgi:hypothetical protein
MKIRQFLKAALAAGLVMAGLLTTGCPNPVDLSHSPATSGAESGKGAVQVSIDDTALPDLWSVPTQSLASVTEQALTPAARSLIDQDAARTVLPGAAQLYYTLAFTKGDETVNGAIGSGVSGSFELDAGTWNLAVTGFLNEGAAADAANALASGSVSDIVVTIGGTTPAAAAMAFTGGETGTGVLRYSISFPATVTSAILTYKKLVDGAATTKNLLVNSDGNTITGNDPKTAAGDPELAAGYYQITVYLFSSSSEYRLQKTEVAHIKGGLTTELAYTFTVADFIPAVSGTISKSSGDAALTGATVTLSLTSGGTEIGTATPDAGGFYTIAAEPAASGVYSLTVELPGYEAKSIAATGTADQNVTLSRIITVSSAANEGAGSFRAALAASGATGVTPDIITVEPAVVTAGIALTAPLTIDTALNLEIRGNGLTISGSGITTSDASRILTIGSSSVHPTVTIRRLRFDGAKVTGSDGGALLNYGKTTLESCIFSGNSARNGGAIYNNGGAGNTLTVKGSTFYNNTITGSGRAVFNYNGSPLSMTGNLFSGNNTASDAPISGTSSTLTTSGGYNIYDGDNAWTIATGDDKALRPTAAPLSLRLLQRTSEALAKLPETLPAGYPTTDFYGQTINASGAAGAVQAQAAGWNITTKATGLSGGGLSVTSGALNSDGLYTGSITLTATPPSGTADATVYQWKLDGVAQDHTTNPWTFNITGHIAVEASIYRVMHVTNTNDSGEGSLRAAIAYTGSDLHVLVDAGLGTITPATTLTISGDITIDGNGVTLSGNNSIKILTIGSSNPVVQPHVTIRRVHFTQGNVSAAAGKGGALENYGLTVLESCIFSNNTVTNGTGGAIYHDSLNNSAFDLTVKGCTFYNNTASSYGGGIYKYRGDAYLAGNTFYASALFGSGTPPASQGYNVSDLVKMTGTGDEQSAGAFLAPTTFKPLVGAEAAGRLPATLPTGYPETDFYGAAIIGGGAAGAIQSLAVGYSLLTAVSGPGSAAISGGTTNADGLYTGQVSVTATPTGGATFERWVKNGAEAGNTNPLTFTIDSHTTVQAVFLRTVTVTSNSGTGSGSLPYALTNALDGDTINISAAGPITLTAGMTLTKSVTINGNGVTIVGSGITTSTTSRILTISGTPTISISRVRFDQGKLDGIPTYGGGAILNTGGKLTLESCVFSNNEVGNAYGGAIYSGGTGASLTVTGSTFYNNKSTIQSGGAIAISSSALTITGNLFSGNTGYSSSSKVVYNTSGTLNGSYNVFDLTSGTTSGWTFKTGDTLVSGGDLVSTKTVRPYSAKIASLRIVDSATATATDFYGNTFASAKVSEKVPAGAAWTDAAGYSLTLQASTGSGTVAITSPAANDDGLYTGSVTVTATPTNGATLDHWVVNGGNVAPSDNTYVFTISAHTTVSAVFVKIVTVTATSGTAEGSLPYALANAVDDDIINITATGPITLTAQMTLNKSVTIKGNGVTLTRDDSWSVSNSSQMLFIQGGTVKISGIHFKGARATSYGSAIRNTAATSLTLESCIFSDNQTSSSTASGGAIMTMTATTISGCTFYNNTTAGMGAVVDFSGNQTLTLRGNLFYGNTSTYSTSSPIVYKSGNGSVSTSGYNVVDVDYGTGDGQAGWAKGTNDKTFTELSISGDPFNATSIKPKDSTELGKLQIVPASTYGFPATDFGGATRSATVSGSNTAAGAWSTGE